MKKLFLVLVFCLLVIFTITHCGCSAGTSAELLAFDNIEAATLEAQKGVVAYNDATKLSLEKMKVAFVKTIASDVYKIAISNDETPESAKARASEIATNLTTALANFSLEENSRNKLFETTMDNLNYILELTAQGKDFTIYKANVSEQWKTYMNAQARAKLGKVE